MSEADGGSFTETAKARGGEKGVQTTVRLRPPECEMLWHSQEELLAGGWIHRSGVEV